MQNQFLGLKPPLCLPDTARWHILPIPYDASVCYRPGARYGPQAIIEASGQMELFDEEIKSEPYKAGIYTHPYLDTVIDPEKMCGLIMERSLKIIGLGNKRICTIGGDHSITIGVVNALYQHYGRLNIIQFDAHLDLRGSYQGSEFSHACVMRRIWDMANIVQIGIRSFSKEEWDFIQKYDHRPIMAHNVKEDLDKSIQAMKNALDPNLPTYITIDLDCLDPSHMPSVGTPEPGGLNWYELTYFLKYIALRSRRIIGFDCVELAPIGGLNFADYTAARLIYKFIGYIFHYYDT